MTEIKLNSQDKETMIIKLQKYMLDELDVELEQFDADFLLDFFSKELGNYFYNQGIYDAQSVIAQKLELISDDLFDLEKPIV